MFIATAQSCYNGSFFRCMHQCFHNIFHHLDCCRLAALCPEYIFYNSLLVCSFSIFSIFVLYAQHSKRIHIGSARAHTYTHNRIELLLFILIVLYCSFHTIDIHFIVFPPMASVRDTKDREMISKSIQVRQSAQRRKLQRVQNKQTNI